MNLIFNLITSPLGGIEYLFLSWQSIFSGKTREKNQKKNNSDQITGKTAVIRRTAARETGAPQGT